MLYSPQILRALRPPTSRQRVALTRAVFDMIDQDRDGLLSCDEVWTKMTFAQRSRYSTGDTHKSSSLGYTSEAVIGLLRGATDLL